MKQALLFLTVLSALTLPATAQWAPIAQYPGGVIDGAGGFSINNKAYIAGGLGKRKLYEYNTAANTWTPKADIGGGKDRAWPAAFAVNGKGYVMGGSYATASDVSSDLWEYNGSTWTQKTAFTGGNRDGMFVFVVGDAAYMGGGFNGTTVVGDFWKYEPAPDKWTQLTNPPFGPALFASAFALDGKGYVTGGSGGSGEINTVYEYNPANGQWTKKKDFPGSARQAAFSFATPSNGYVGGGMTGYTSVYNDVWKYTVSSDSWIKVQDIPLPYPAWSTVIKTDSFAIVGTGANFAGSSLNFTDSMYKFTHPVSIGDVNNDLQLALYPNPATDIISIDGITGTAIVRIYDVAGRLALQATINQTTTGTIDISGLDKGVYLIDMEVNGNTGHTRFVKL